MKYTHTFPPAWDGLHAQLEIAIAQRGFESDAVREILREMLALIEVPRRPRKIQMELTAAVEAAIPAWKLNKAHDPIHSKQSAANVLYDHGAGDYLVQQVLEIGRAHQRVLKTRWRHGRKR